MQREEWTAMTVNGCLAMTVLGLMLNRSAAEAQTAAASDRLAKVKALTCTFSQMVVERWKEGDPQIEMKSASLAMTFESIDPEEGSARTADAFGPAQLVVKLSGNALHMMQSLSEGPVYLTTVFDKDSHPGKLRAVHTRHANTDMTLPGFTSSPEQYYGECTVARSAP
jgi:hypothetical protein